MPRPAQMCPKSVYRPHICSKIPPGGTDAHEQLKTTERLRKTVEFENIKHTEFHERRKDNDRKRKFKDFSRLVGTAEHEIVKKAKRIR